MKISLLENAIFCPVEFQFLIQVVALSLRDDSSSYQERSCTYSNSNQETKFDWGKTIAFLNITKSLFGVKILEFNFNAVFWSWKLNSINVLILKLDVFIDIKPSKKTVWEFFGGKIKDIFSLFFRFCFFQKKKNEFCI